MRRRAFAVPVARWQRVLGFEGCIVHFDRALQSAGLAAEAPPALRRLLREATSAALERGILVHRQVGEVAAIAATHRIPVMALKGAARLLDGELAGRRSIGDIDLLTRPDDALHLHELLQREAGYSINGPAYPHHLAGLTRSGSLGIEIHTRLTPKSLPLDDSIWRDARAVRLNEHDIGIPSPTNLFLHTLEHAVRVNWSGRYRLRDIVDLAMLFTDEVDAREVGAHVAARSCRRPMEVILGAARALEPRIPFGEVSRWNTVRRVGRTRLALASLPVTPLVAERLYRYAGALAEGSPRTLGRLGIDLVRRLASSGVSAALALLALGATAGCSDFSAPPPAAVESGPIVFAANTGGVWSLYRVIDGVASPLSTPGSNDREPHSAAGRIVFTSLRDGNAEIYGAPLNADFTLGTQTRLTSDFSTDAEPALSPGGATIAFVSGRGGAPRVWLMDATGANPRPLETGSPDYVPEGSPRWSPDGDRIVFTSARTGSSQVYVVALAGGGLTQVSHETRGAFGPAWLPNGTRVIFMTLTGEPRLLSAPATGGDASVFATDSAGLGEPSCNAAVCVAVLDPLGSAGRVVVLTPDGHRTKQLIPSVADDHHPAFLVRP